MLIHLLHSLLLRLSSPTHVSPLCIGFLFHRDSNNFGGVDSVELFADQLLEITTQVLRADDNGR